MLEITSTLFLDEAELAWSFVRSAGPGGQNVNKVSSAVQLRWNVRANTSLPPALKARLKTLAGRRMNLDGELVLLAQGQRSQLQNREEVLARLLELLKRAAVAPVRRKKTRPTLASKKRHAESKSRTGDKKANRGKVRI